MGSILPFMIYGAFSVYALLFLSIFAGFLYYRNNEKNTVQGLVGGFFFLLSCLLVGSGLAYLMNPIWLAWQPENSFCSFFLPVLIFSLLNVGMTWVPSLAFGIQMKLSSRILIGVVSFILLSVTLPLVIAVSAS